MKQFLIDHLPYWLLILLQSYLEYKKGLDKNKENSYLELVINKLRRK